MKRLALSLAAAALAVAGVAAQGHKLWYDRPAMTWTQALPVGNGRLGGMVFGNPAVERVQLNEETIWAGQPNFTLNPRAKAALPRVRKLIAEGKYREAQNLADADIMPGGKPQPRNALPDLRRPLHSHARPRRVLRLPPRAEPRLSPCRW